MNYLDYGKRITEDVLKKAFLESSIREISDIAGWRNRLGNLFSDDVMVGLVDTESQLAPGGSFKIIAPIEYDIFRKNWGKLGSYYFEGVHVGNIESDYKIIEDVFENKELTVDLLGNRYKYSLESRIVLPHERFIPLYVSRFFDADIKYWPPSIVF